MSRLRVTFIMAGLIVAFAAMALTSNAQQQGGRGGRGARGQRGQGGPGGGMWGGTGGPGSNLLMLASNDAVQKELNLSDKQKAQVKKISEDSNNRRRDAFQNLRQRGDMAKRQAAQQAQAELQQAQQIDPSLAARGSGANDPLINSLNSRGYQPPIFGGQQLEDPVAAQQARQAQVQARVNNAQAQNWQMMQGAMQRLEFESERNLGRVLDKNQAKRLKEIQLQVQGPFAVLQPEIAEKLELQEEQVVQIREIQNESNLARRQAFAAGRGIFAGMRKNQRGNNNQSGAGDNGRAQNGNNGGQNGRGGNGGGGRGNFDPEAMRKYMEQPEVKARMADMRKQQDVIRDQSYAMVYRVLDRRQSSAFKKMLGKPFDVDSIRNGFFRGPSQRNNGPDGAAAKAEASGENNAKVAVGEQKQADQPAASKPATSTRRPSLRERRGLGQPQPQ